jgi:hypothetical protein
VPRVGDDAAGGAQFDDPTKVHNSYAVGEMSRGREVVRDHQDRHPLSSPEAVQQRKDAGTNRDVQHRHGLVGNE